MCKGLEAVWCHLMAYRRLTISVVSCWLYHVYRIIFAKSAIYLYQNYLINIAIITLHTGIDQYLKCFLLWIHDVENPSS